MAASGKEAGKEEGQRGALLLRLSLRPSLWGIVRNA